MKKSSKLQLPAKLARGCRRFEKWRHSHKPHSRIPKPLWSLAVELAREFGISKTAGILRLDYNDLKRLVALSVSETNSPVPPPPSFLELCPPEASRPLECTVECEDSQGGRIRIHIIGGPLPDLTALCGELWSQVE